MQAICAMLLCTAVAKGNVLGITHVDAKYVTYLYG